MCVLCPLLSLVWHILALCPILPQALHFSDWAAQTGSVNLNIGNMVVGSTCSLLYLWSVARDWCRSLYFVDHSWGTGRQFWAATSRAWARSIAFLRSGKPLPVVSLASEHLPSPKLSCHREYESNVSPNFRYSVTFQIRMVATILPDCLQRVILFEALNKCSWNNRQCPG